MTTDPLTEAAERLLAQVAEVVRGRRLPEATYRLQFHKGFTFRDATAIVPYLHDLGVTHLYASPYLQARPGSMHGYDITNHQRLNPEVGTDADYEALIAALHQNGLGQVFDMVPNHMGVLGNENPWWNDVLENGPASAYANYFDITWQSSPRPELHNRLLVPILGDPYGKALEAQQIRLEYAAGAFAIHYYRQYFPHFPMHLHADPVPPARRTEDGASGNRTGPDRVPQRPQRRRPPAGTHRNGAGKDRRAAA